ncbi:MAG TPA: hypothetical protein VF624_02510 [Tepidisphaeraceae bacterium]|jgi:hypothetical protein
MKRVLGVLMAAGITSVLFAAAGCSSDNDDSRSDRDVRQSRRDPRDYADKDRDGIRDGLEDRNRNGVRDQIDNGGPRDRRERDADRYR